MEIYLSNPRGFCAGVDRAISIVERALNLFDQAIYVHHEVVHNKYVVENLKNKGAIFVDGIDEIPANNICIFSAHGVSKKVKQQALVKNLKIFDATCPLVTKVHMEVARASKKEIECILIGHKGHIEVIGTLGQYENPNAGIYLVENIADVDALKIKNPAKLIYATQTTLSLDDTKEIVSYLKQKYPQIKEPHKKDICYATQNRQNAVSNLAKKVDLMLVVGSKNSSNSNRLKEKAIREGTKAYLIDNYQDVDLKWFENIEKIGITAGASAPEILVQEIIDFLQQKFNATVIETQGIEEKTKFAIPVELI